MKTMLLFVLSCILLLYPSRSPANPFPTPMFGVHLRATSVADTAILFFGILPVSERCLNPADCFGGQCEVGLLPIPPPPAFDARFLPPPSCTGYGSLCDFRPFITRTQRDTFSVNAQFDGMGTVTFHWPARLDSSFTELRMVLPGQPAIDMLTDTSVTASNPSGQLIAAIISTGLVVVGVEEIQRPSGSVAVAQNYPNPFNPKTVIKFQVPRQNDGGQASSKLVDLRVYDVLGREVATLVNERKEPGVHSVTWDATGIAGGVYFYRLQAGSFAAVKKMVVLK